MKPDDVTLDTLRVSDMFKNHLDIDMVAKCFEEDAKNYPDTFPQSLVNMLFIIYVMGLTQPLTPGSFFNLNYKKGRK